MRQFQPNLAKQVRVRAAHKHVYRRISSLFDDNDDANTHGCLTESSSTRFFLLIDRIFYTVYTKTDDVVLGKAPNILF